MNHIEIKKEKQPLRCEVCHQTDQFNAHLNKCLRCSDIRSISHKDNLEVQTINEVISNQNIKEIQSQDYILLYQRRKNELSILIISLFCIGIVILYILIKQELILITTIFPWLIICASVLISLWRDLFGLFDKCPHCKRFNPILKDSKNCQYCSIHLKKY